MNELWLLKDKFGQTAWHMAAGGGHTEVLEKLWDWAKIEKLHPDCLKSAGIQLTIYHMVHCRI